MLGFKREVLSRRKAVTICEKYLKTKPIPEHNEALKLPTGAKLVNRNGEFFLVGFRRQVTETFY